MELGVSTQMDWFMVGRRRLACCWEEEESDDRDDVVEADRSGYKRTPGAGFQFAS